MLFPFQCQRIDARYRHLQRWWLVRPGQSGRHAYHHVPTGCHTVEPRPGIHPTLVENRPSDRERKSEDVVKEVQKVTVIVLVD